ncbi:helix-turn-helix domain-containing protein [Marinilactibacillus psychrotolerans]|uniref:helix-turn-helix domain-containing protein n=1 Tax=Carnobacteriaceae TaxID=186828 RepID=UPI001C7DAFAA|nr:helix-turn-helix domain-containing protein [Marinilactibacillus psychrotolerans]GEQ34478.1 transposase [Marinilactibacillus psychrotolerans]
MAKYSQEFKLKLVKEYENGNLGYKSLAKKYGIPDSSPIRKWVNFYQLYGKEGLSPKKSKEVYPVHFKLDVLQFMKQTGSSYQEAANSFGIREYSMIANWNRAFNEDGIEGLKPKQKGRPSMSKLPKKKNMNNSQKMSREQELERENELLRLENAYLKKLKAYEENPNAFLEKHKQHWHLSSKKKDIG